MSMPPRGSERTRVDSSKFVDENRRDAVIKAKTPSSSVSAGLQSRPGTVIEEEIAEVQVEEVDVEVMQFSRRSGTEAALAPKRRDTERAYPESSIGTESVP